MEILFRVRTAAKRRAGFGDEQKSCRTLTAEARSPLKENAVYAGRRPATSYLVMRGSLTMAEAAS